MLLLKYHNTLLIISFLHFQVNYLNDTHAQLMVHWLGEGSDVMICLAREPPLGPLDLPNKTPVPSSVYISYDYGDTFLDKTDLFRVLENGTEVNSTLDQFMTHPNFNTVSLFGCGEIRSFMMTSPRLFLISNNMSMNRYQQLKTNYH